MTTTVQAPTQASGGARTRRRRKGGGQLSYWPYLLPGGILFVGVILVPFVMNLYFSMTKWAGIGDPKWVGLKNYSRLLQDDTFWLSFRNSIAMIIAMVVVPTILGLLLASVLFDYLGRRFPGRVASTLRATYYLPQILPVAVAGILWGWILNPQTGVYAGTRTGWLGYGWNGFGFNPSNLALISQLGYPVALDSGRLMERTDSQAYVDGSLSNNSVIGSLQTGGSSGGPWPVNLGLAPSLSGTSFGAEATHNIVVGVTSWGYVSTAIKEQGASPFTSGNIVPLVNAACSFAPAACT